MNRIPVETLAWLGGAAIFGAALVLSLVSGVPLWLAMVVCVSVVGGVWLVVPRLR